jgi:hypothetical protein
MLLRARYLVDAVGHNRVRGMPLQVEDLMAAIVDVHQSVDETR